MAPVAHEVTALGPAETPLSVSRVQLNDAREPVPVAFEGQDAWYVIFQLRDAPAHDFRQDGRAETAPPSPRGAVHIADLRREPSARLQGRFESLNFHLPMALLERVAEGERAARVHDLDTPEPWRTLDPVVERLAGVMLSALRDPAPPGRLLLDSLAVSFTLHLAERYGDLRRPVIRKGALAPWQERRAKALIAADLRGDLSLADVAAECRLSLAHFSRAFKVSTGETPHGFLQARRIDRAKQLLRGAQPLAEIAVEAGFADQSHFTRTFRRLTGAPPGAWRRG
jgi:AraC family transcriptional regulator